MWSLKLKPKTGMRCGVVPDGVVLNKDRAVANTDGPLISQNHRSNSDETCGPKHDKQHR